MLQAVATKQLNEKFNCKVFSHETDNPELPPSVQGNKLMIKFKLAKLQTIG